MAITPDEEVEPFVDMTGQEPPPLVYLTQEEVREMFDARARELMGISGKEFLRRLDAGEYDDIIDSTRYPHGMHIIDLEMIRPFGW